MHGILGFLTYGEMSGYDLLKAFHSSVQFFWPAQNSQIYLELKKLENLGYVTCQAEPEKRNRKNFKITESGKQEFFRWLAEGEKTVSKEMKNAFLLKVFFSGSVSPAQSIEMLRRFAQDCRDYQASMEIIPDKLQEYQTAVDPYQALYWQFTADFGDCYLHMCIDWAERCIQKLEEFL